MSSLLTRLLLPRAPKHGLYKAHSILSEAMMDESKPSAAKEKSLNQVELLGRVGGEPQKRGSDENPVVIFSLATSTAYNSSADPSTRTEKTDWHRICVFKPYLREVVYQNMSKGDRVLVQGRLSYFDTKDENGEKTGSLSSIIANEIIFVSSARSNKKFNEN